MSKVNYPFTMVKLAVLVVLSGFMASCSAGPIAEISVSQAVVKRPLTGKTQTVAYFELHNNSTKQKTLKQVRSQIAGTIELHTTIKSGSTLRMQRLSELIIPAHSSVSFSPGGKHLMLFRVAELNATGAILEFYFSDDSTYAVEFSIEDY